jgi:hypothetical protein
MVRVVLLGKQYITALSSSIATEEPKFLAMVREQFALQTDLLKI